MTFERNGKTEKSGLFLLETYIVPGYVSYIEENGDAHTLKAILSPELKERPAVLRALKEDVAELSAFVKSLCRNPAMTVPSLENEAPSNPSLLLLSGFQKGSLRFFRDGKGRPTVFRTERFSAPFPDPEDLLKRFVSAVNAFGPEDEKLIAEVLKPSESVMPDHLIRLDASAREEYDTVNEEFTFTHLSDPSEEAFRKARSEAVRENAEFALQKTTELLKDIAGVKEGQEGEKES